jgi:hypothetical protein
LFVRHVIHSKVYSLENQAFFSELWKIYFLFLRFTTNFNAKPGGNNIYRGKCENCQTMLRFKIVQDDIFLKEIDNISFTVNGQLQNS